MTAVQMHPAPVPHQERNAHVIRLAGRTSLFDEADDVLHLYEIMSGSIMIFKLLSDGRRQILEVLRAGDFAGLTRGDTYGYGALTLCPCTLRRYDRQAATTSPFMQQRLSRYLLERQDAVYAHALLLGRNSAAERLAMFFAGPAHLKDAEFDVHLSLREVSEYLGLRPETVSRQINRLCKLGLLSRSGWGAYRVKDRHALSALASV